MSLSSCSIPQWKHSEKKSRRNSGKRGAVRSGNPEETGNPSGKNSIQERVFRRLKDNKKNDDNFSKTSGRSLLKKLILTGLRNIKVAPGGLKDGRIA